MSAKFISTQLVNSARFSVGGNAKENSTHEAEALTENEHGEPPAAPSRQSVEETSELQQILKREHDDIRRNALDQGVEETAQSRRETLEILREISSDIRQRSETLDAYRKLFDSTAANIVEHCSEINPDNLGTVRRAIDHARMEIIRFEKDILKRHDNKSTAASDRVAPGLDGISFATWVKIGLALTWPIVFAILAAAGIGAAVLLSLFTV